MENRCNNWRLCITGSIVLVNHPTSSKNKGIIASPPRATNPGCNRISRCCSRSGPADFVEVAPADHGRIETRRIWCSTALNDYIDFPYIGQVFLIERESVEKKTNKPSHDTALGLTSRTPQEASTQRVLTANREHWGIESVHYIIDWNYDEDRSRISKGYGPENISRLRRFAVGILKSFQKPNQTIAELMRKLSFRTRIVFDYLRMTKNSITEPCQA